MSHSNGGVLPDLELQPGELFLARGPAILRTILGSCVGVTFWCRRLSSGALCHGVLPRCQGDANPEPAEGARYVDFSIRHLTREFERLGASRRELEVKLFGGADVLPGSGPRDRPTIGLLNCLAAREVAAEMCLTVVAIDLGGVQGRRIHFHTGTGEILLQRLPSWRIQATGSKLIST